MLPFCHGRREQSLEGQGPQGEGQGEAEGTDADAQGRPVIRKEGQMKLPRTITVRISTLLTWSAILALAGGLWIEHRTARNFELQTRDGVEYALRQLLNNR